MASLHTAAQSMPSGTLMVLTVTSLTCHQDTHSSRQHTMVTCDVPCTGFCQADCCSLEACVSTGSV